jgi:hypothetical protein
MGFLPRIPPPPVPENYHELVRKGVLPRGIVRVAGRYVADADMRTPGWVLVLYAGAIAAAVAVIATVVIDACAVPPAAPAAVERR